MTFKAPESLAEQIAQYLAQRIITGELKAGERIQELKVTQALDVSRGSVREALLILERRHLIVNVPRRGAQVTQVTPEHVKSLYALVTELYSLLAQTVLQNWQEQAELSVFFALEQRLLQSLQLDDIEAFVEASFAVMRAAYPLANNPYLQHTLENLLPAVSRTYYLALERRRGEMSRFMATFSALLQAVLARDGACARHILQNYAEHNCALVLAVLNVRQEAA